MNNYDKLGPVSNTEQKIQPRIIQIPVQHIKTPLNATNSTRDDSPLRNSKLANKSFQDSYGNPTFTNRPSIFDRFDSNFGNKNTKSLKQFHQFFVKIFNFF